MIVFDVQVIGTWKRTIAKKIDMEFDFFEPINKHQSMAFDEAVNHYSEFMKLKVNKIERTMCGLAWGEW